MQKKLQKILFAQIAGEKDIKRTNLIIESKKKEMNKKITLLLCCIIIGSIAFTQGTSKYNLRDLKHAFNRTDAGSDVVNIRTIYICLYGGTKGGWNPKTNDYYPVEDKVIYSKIYRLTDVPVPEYFNLSNLNSTIYGGLQKQFMQHLIAQYGFNEEINYCTFEAGFDLNNVEKKLQENMDAKLNNYAKVKFQYDTKFSFDYSDAYYKASYKGD